MIKIFGNLFDPGRAAKADEPARPEPAQPEPLPADLRAEYLAWYRAQTRPAVMLVPDPARPVAPTGSRLFGPAWLPAGETWPTGTDGLPLELLAQINLAECPALAGFPKDGLLQFFIGRGDTHGAGFDDLQHGNFLVRRLPANTPGSLHPAPLLAGGDGPDDAYLSPCLDPTVGERGIALVAEPIVDQIDLSVREASDRFYALGEYDLDPLYDAIDEIGRPLRHHIGGYPAFTQQDVRADPRYGEYDTVLLRLTSDAYVLWGDAGECVFLIRSGDLARGDVSQVIYTWDCT